MKKLTERAQEAIVAAQRLAEDRRHTQLEPEHLLHALVSQEGGVAPAVLTKLGVQPSAVLQQLEPALSALATASTPTEVRISPRLHPVWEMAHSGADPAQ